VPFPGESLGEILLAITQDKPEPVTQMRPELPKAIDDWMKRALSQDRTKRFQTAQEMAEAICQVAEPAAISAKNDGNQSTLSPVTQPPNPSTALRSSSPAPNLGEVVLPSKFESIFEKLTSRIALAAPWLEPLVRPHGRPFSDNFQEFTQRGKQSFKESFEDHRQAWLIVFALVAMIFIVVLLIAVL
jgi:hypothetical protein